MQNNEGEIIDLYIPRKWYVGRLRVQFSWETMCHGGTTLTVARRTCSRSARDAHGVGVGDVLYMCSRLCPRIPLKRMDAGAERPNGRLFALPRWGTVCSER